MRYQFFVVGLVISSVGMFCSWSQAAQRAQDILPPTVKGYVSVENIQQFLRAWQETQLGALLRDPQLQPFVQEVQQRIRQNLSETNLALAVDWELILQLATGQVAAAVLEPEGENSHAVVVLLDVNDSCTLAQTLTGIDQVWQQRRATVTKHRIRDTDVVEYTIPTPAGRNMVQHAYYAMAAGKWIATDNEQVLRDILNRLYVPGQVALAQLESYRATQEHTVLLEGRVAPHVRWYVEPFGYARIVRATRLERQRGTDVLKILQQQGFDAVEAIGGQLAFAHGEYQLLHQTLVYAPGERRLAARMLHFPNGPALEPERWVPGNVANYIALRWDMQGAFESMKTLVDALTSEGFFEEFLASLERDAKGPQVNLRTGFVQHLGDNLVFLSDCIHPITPQSERFAVGVEVRNTQVVATTVHRMLEKDRTAKRRQLGDHIVWEIAGDQSEEEITLSVEVEVPTSFGFGTKREEVVREELPRLPSTAVAVAKGRVWFSSHPEFLAELLNHSPETTLAEQADYQRVAEALRRLGAGHECFRLFSRSAETYHATYELIRQGRMAESESLFGKWLNYAKSTSSGSKREQILPAGNLPPFEQVRRYLGPAGVYSRQHHLGWTITGCLLDSGHITQ